MIVSKQKLNTVLKIFDGDNIELEDVFRLQTLKHWIKKLFYFQLRTNFCKTRLNII